VFAVAQVDEALRDKPKSSGPFPDGIIEIFIDLKFWPRYGPRVESVF
jgi:hypothetical protein